MSSLPELSFELSIGDVIIILVLVALILLVIIMDRTKVTLADAQLLQTPQPLSTKECPARFGFLQRVPRGGTIPEECYVCSQLIGCLGFQRSSKT